MDCTRFGVLSNGRWVGAQFFDGSMGTDYSRLVANRLGTAVPLSPGHEEGALGALHSGLYDVRIEAASRLDSRPWTVESTMTQLWKPKLETRHLR